MLRDLFYFRKGERRALIVLLVLALVSWWWLAYQATPSPPTPEEQESPKKEASHPEPKQKRPPIPTSTEKKKTLPRKKYTVSSQEFRETKSIYKKPPLYPRTPKLPKGSIVELNTANTTLLKQVPGIGTIFAKRIVGYRRLLGGYASVSQLSEVYGIDSTRYAQLKAWFKVDTNRIHRLNINALPIDSLTKHPYLNYKQARTITRLVQQKGHINSWENLLLMEEFTPTDQEKLKPYLKFQDNI